MHRDPRARSPVIGITTDLEAHANGTRVFSYLTYADAVARAGGTPVLLPPVEGSAASALAACDGFVLSGGDDPATEPFGVPTHPAAIPLDPRRQRFELDLLERHRATAPDKPILGVCLGMQLMALAEGGRLDQHLPDSCPTHALHWEAEHPVEPVADAPREFQGLVRSRHRQAVTDPGRLRVLARSPDGLIEAIDDPARPFRLGVQWHPERTAAPGLGQRLFDALVAAARA